MYYLFVKSRRSCTKLAGYQHIKASQHNFAADLIRVTVNPTNTNSFLTLMSVTSGVIMKSVDDLANRQQTPR